MARIALATCSQYAGLHDDDRLLLKPLEAQGLDVTPAVWDDPRIDWATFDLCVLRSTWDYAGRREAFLTWADSVANLVNPARIVRWNTDKRYIRELASADVPVVSTWWIRPGEPVVLPGRGDRSDDEVGRAAEYVVKPSVSAGAVDTGRYRADDPEHRELARAHVARLLQRGATVMIQPYLTAVDAFGETALLFIDGEFSHAIRKAPMLDGPDRGVSGLYREERITARTPSTQERKVADLVLEAVPAAREMLYARVDLIPGADGSPILLELELTEPSLFFEFGGDAAERFAAAVAARC